MRNPWVDTYLPSRPTCCLWTEKHVEAFNRHANDRHRLDLRLLPHPFLGNRRAPLVILNLNPGIRPDSLLFQRGALARIERENIEGDSRSHVHPGLISGIHTPLSVSGGESPSKSYWPMATILTNSRIAS